MWGLVGFGVSECSGTTLRKPQIARAVSISASAKVSDAVLGLDRLFVFWHVFRRLEPPKLCCACHDSTASYSRHACAAVRVVPVLVPTATGPRRG